MILTYIINLTISILIYALIIVIIKKTRKNQDKEQKTNTYYKNNEEQDYYISTYYQITHNTYESIIYDKGKYGEYIIYKILKQYEETGGKLLFNCYLNKEDETTTEIDVILIHQSGIYVIESKDYSGWIFGNEKDKYWTQTLPGKKGQAHKEKFYNPIWQNKTHINNLKRYIGSEYKINSIIVFSDICELKNIQNSDNNVKIIKAENLLSTIKNIEQTSTQPIKEENIKEIYEKIYPTTQISEEIKTKHIENIKLTTKNNNNIMNM
jgi:hypothetical protein